MQVTPAIPLQRGVWPSRHFGYSSPPQQRTCGHQGLMGTWAKLPKLTIQPTPGALLVTSVIDSRPYYRLNRKVSLSPFYK